MTFDTQMTLALMQALLLTLRANDPYDSKAWLSLGIERLGKPAVNELLVDWMDPILTTEEADRLVGWHPGGKPVIQAEEEIGCNWEIHSLHTIHKMLK